MPNYRASVLTNSKFIGVRVDTQLKPNYGTEIKKNSSYIRLFALYVNLLCFAIGFGLQARKHNPTHQIGGVLYFSNNYFFQCLEGGQDVVNKLYNKITEDPRHENVQSLSVKRVNDRYFSNWSMKYVALEESVNNLLKQYGYKTFQPYDFNDELVDKMLKLFVNAKDFSGASDQNYDTAVIAKHKPGLLRWLFRR